MIRDFLRNHLDNINSLLIFIAFTIAIAIPFELFLFAYAVIGPIHYLSEIAWLDKKNFFINSKIQRNFFVFLAFFVATLFLIKFFSDNYFRIDFSKFYIDKFISSLIFLTFAIAGLLALFQSSSKFIILLISIILLALILRGIFLYEIIFSILLTTIIHVWLFTAIFMINGAISSKSKYALLTLIIFLFCSLAIFFIENNNYKMSQFAYNALSLGNITGINNLLSDIFSFEVRNSFNANNNVQSFIAFAYSYHYLNWFSKVEIIKWHKLSRPKILAITGFYLLVLGFYFIDYRTGFLITIFLSMAHVFLEFPLNFLSFQQLKNHIYLRK